MSRSRLPDWLRDPLVGVWNDCHRVGLQYGEFLGAVRHGRFGRCEVCGLFGPWLYQRRVVPPRLEELWGLSPRQAEALARKETSTCSWCGAKLRARRLARVLLETYPVGTPPTPAASVARWVRSPRVRALRVAEVNRIEGLHRPLSRLPLLKHSEYLPGVERGFEHRGLRAEDLTRLTYPDDSFDLVLTSETLEHVPDLSAALAEVRRVLVPGGWHLFTVPVLPGVPKTFPRMTVRPDGTRAHQAAEIRHPGGDVGYPVFTEFGADLPEILDRSGFETTVHFGPVRDDDLAQVYACRKPLAT
jgi:SAM-dependent methyltransferase